MAGTYTYNIIELVFFLSNHLRVADIPHNIEAFGVPAIRTVKFAASKYKNHICVYFTVPVFVQVNYSVHSHSIQVTFQGNCIRIIAPTDLFFLRSRTFDHPDLTFFRFTLHLCSPFSPVVPAMQFLWIFSWRLFSFSSSRSLLSI